MSANWETARWIFCGLLAIGGGVALLTGHTPAGILALTGGLGGLGYLGRPARPVIRRYVAKGGQGSGTRARRKAA